MSMSTQSLAPNTEKSMLYPKLSIDKTRPSGKHYQCPRCQGNLRSRIQAQIIRKSEIVFGFSCADCGNRWYLSSKLILNEVLEEQCQKIHKFTMTTKKEFGGLLVKTPEGIRIDMIDIGEDLSVTFKKTKEYRADEKIVGTIHAHPITDIPSDWDIATFLRDDFEKISVVVGSEGTVNVMVKTKDTVKIAQDGVQKWVQDNQNVSFTEKANAYRFLLFRGKVNNLKLCGGASNMTVTSLEKLFSQVDTMVTY